MNKVKLLVLFLFVANSIYACSCSPIHSKLQIRTDYFKESDLVALCEVDKQNKVEPIEVFKGGDSLVNASLDLVTYSSCDLNISKKGLWILYLTWFNEGVVAEICGPNERLSSKEWSNIPISPDYIQFKHKHEANLIKNKLSIVEHLNWLRHRKMLNELSLLYLKSGSTQEKELRGVDYVLIGLFSLVLLVLGRTLKK